MPTTLTSATPPDAMAPSADFTLHVGGKPVFVYDTPVGGYALLQADGPAEVELQVGFDFSRCVIRPLSRGVSAEINGRRVRFEMPSPVGRSCHLSIEFHDADGKLMLRRPLFLLASPPYDEPSGANVRTFAPGKVHDVGTLELRSGETVHIPAGAVVRGVVRAEGAEDIRLIGGGILDGSQLPHALNGEVKRPRFCIFADCQGVRMEGVTIVDSPSWTVIPVGCDGVIFREVKIVNGWANDDAFDLVGSRNVLLDRCFARAKDDCIAIKALDNIHPAGNRNVEHVRVTGGTFWNAEWGNAIEIGYETRCDVMRDIAFEDCDIIRCEEERFSSGGAITIHNGDRAEVSDVLYRDIRIEDARHKLIDFKITWDRYSRDTDRGSIRRILLDRVHVVDGPFAPSLLQGWGNPPKGPPIMIEDVLVRDLEAHGQRIDNAVDARFITERVQGLRFEVTG